MPYKKQSVVFRLTPAGEAEFSSLSRVPTGLFTVESKGEENGFFATFLGVPPLMDGAYTLTVFTDGEPLTYSLGVRAGVKGGTAQAKITGASLLKNATALMTAGKVKAVAVPYDDEQIATENYYEKEKSIGHETLPNAENTVANQNGEGAQKKDDAPYSDASAFGTRKLQEERDGYFRRLMLFAFHERALERRFYPSEAYAVKTANGKPLYVGRAGRGENAAFFVAVKGRKGTPPKGAKAGARFFPESPFMPEKGYWVFAFSYKENRPLF